MEKNDAGSQRSCHNVKILLISRLSLRHTRRETAPGATTKKAHFYLTRCLLKKCCDFSNQNLVLFILTYSLSGLLLIAIPLATAAIVNCY